MKLSDVIDNIKNVYIGGEFVNINDIEFSSDDLNTEVEDNSFTAFDSGNVSKDITLYIGDFEGKKIGFYA